MRMRKKKWARPYILTRNDVVVQDPALLKGKWKETLNCLKLHLEIGSGKGAYWIGMANKYPDEGWVALERSADAAAIGLKKCEEPGKNMKLIINDAQLIDQWFDEGEIDVIHLNFSDPWPKKAHTKRRLTSDTFLNKYRSLLSKEGTVVLKTDNLGLYEYSLENMVKGFELVSRDDNFRAVTHDEDQITEYEQDFINVGLPIYRAIFKVIK